MTLAQLFGQVGDRLREVDADDRVARRGQALRDPSAEALCSTGDHHATGPDRTIEGALRALVDGSDHGFSWDVIASGQGVAGGVARR